ncbi:hypothetical protein ACROYT_G019617 [Oculina patagonica]
MRNHYYTLKNDRLILVPLLLLSIVGAGKCGSPVACSSQNKNILYTANDRTASSNTWEYTTSVPIVRMRRTGNEIVEISVKRPASMHGRVDQALLPGLVVKLSHLRWRAVEARAIVMDGTISRIGIVQIGTALVGARRSNVNPDWLNTSNVTDHNLVVTLL